MINPPQIVQSGKLSFRAVQPPSWGTIISVAESEQSMDDKLGASVGLNAINRLYLPADHSMVPKMDGLPGSLAVVADAALTTKVGMRVYVPRHDQRFAFNLKYKTSLHQGHGVRTSKEWLNSSRLIPSGPGVRHGDISRPSLSHSQYSGASREPMVLQASYLLVVRIPGLPTAMEKAPHLVAAC